MTWTVVSFRIFTQGSLRAEYSTDWMWQYTSTVLVCALATLDLLLNLANIASRNEEMKFRGGVGLPFIVCLNDTEINRGKNNK